MEWLYIRGRSAASRLRWFVLLTVGVLVGIFVATTVPSATVGAQAVWSGESISNNGDLYTKITDAQTLSALGVSSNADVYGFLNSSVDPKIMQTIQMPAGSPSNQSITAQLIFYTFTPPNTYTQQSSSNIAVQVDTGQTGRSCAVEGVGWLVCGLSTWIADGMDAMYGLLDDLMKTPAPRLDDPRDSIRISWEVMRNIANVVFVISFIMIIYSHLTSVGINNYGIKRMLPRLIIAAITMNLSLMICVLFIDISNILGVALQDMFLAIRDNLVANTPTSDAISLGWSDVTAILLSAGGAAAAAAGAYTVGGVSAASTPLLVPLLLTVLLALVVVFVVLAARQAIIVILTILSPIAFVLYLLPGTEKWFEKWRETMFTMLLFFPAFSVVFGGAQLAGTVILVSPNPSIILVLLGLAVQVAPLAIAPLVMKLGGGVLNRFAGIVNNPSRGLIDKSKQWAGEKSEAIKLERWADADNVKGWRRKLGYGALRRGMRSLDHRGRARKENLERLRKEADNNYHESNRFKGLDLKSRHANDRASLIEQQNSNRYDALKAGQKPTDIFTPRQSALHRVPFASEARRAEADAKLANKAALRSGKLAEAMQPEMTATAEQLSAAGMQKTLAQRKLNEKVAEEILNNTALQQAAGGLYGEMGIEATIANAVAVTRSEYGKSVEESAELLKHYKVDSNSRQQLATGMDIEVKDEHGVVIHRFSGNNPYAVEAAIEEQLAVGTVNQVVDILSKSGSSLSGYRGTISASLAKSGVKGKAPFLSGKLIDDVYKGEIANIDNLNQYIADWVKSGKFKPQDISIIDKEGLELLTRAISGDYQRAHIGDDRLKGLRFKIEQALKDPRLNANMADNTIALFKNLRNSLPELSDEDRKNFIA